jgi:acetamidase/formamidase
MFANSLGRPFVWQATSKATVAAAAVDLRIGQLVDVPNCIASAVLPLDIFVD